MHSDSPDMKKKYGNENRINLKENTANVYNVTDIAQVQTLKVKMIPHAKSIHVGVSPTALYCVVDTSYGLGRSLGHCRPPLPKVRKY